MRWKDKPLLFFIFIPFLLLIGAAIFVVAQAGPQTLIPALSDTPSVPDTLATLLTGNLIPALSDTPSVPDTLATLLTGNLIPATADAIPLTDSLQPVLIFASAPVSSPSGGSIDLNISDGVFISGPSIPPLTVTTPTPQQLQAVQQQLASNQSVTFPHGIVSFVAATQQGQVVTIIIEYPSLPSLASNQSFVYYKINPNNPNDVRVVPQGSGDNTFSISSNTVILRIKDNGPLDFSQLDGIIYDPGGIAIVTTQPPAGGGGGAVGGGGGGGGGGGAVIIRPTKSTVETQLALQALPLEVSLDKAIAVEGALTDGKGNRLPLDGRVTVTVIAESGSIKVYTATLEQGEFSIPIKARELLKALKSRTVDITVRFDGSTEESRQKIVEYKGVEVKHRLKITGESIEESVKRLKREGASLIKLDNFTEKSIGRIVLKAESTDGKIIYAKGKDMDRKRISMNEVELIVKDGKVIGFGDTARLLVYARGTVTCTVYDMQGNVIGEGRL